MNNEIDTADDTENETQKIKLRLNSEKIEKTVNSVNLPISIILAAAVVLFVIVMAVIAKGNMNKAETAATAEVTVTQTT